MKMTTNYENLDYKNFATAKKDIKVSYLGNVAHSTKLMHSLTEMKISTYGIYLAPSDISGYNVCQNSVSCREHCLFGSGHAMMDILNHNARGVVAGRARKTRLFFENRPYFMQWMIAEITKYKLLAELEGLKFAVRLNCTSDINISDFEFEGKNICDIFPDVQFYDYTKVYNHLDNLAKFPNYDLTYSYNGFNWGQCEKALNRNVRVAVVFEKHLPATFHGYRVINGDLYDSRYFDDKNVIIGLKFKVVASAIKNKKYTMPKTPFIVVKDDVNVVW